MKICIFTDSFYPKIDGIAISITETVRRLADKGHSLVVFCPNDLGDKEELDLGSKVTIERIFSVPLLSYKEVRVPLVNGSEVQEVVKLFNPDALLLTAPGLIGRAAVNVHKSLGIPLAGIYTTVVAEQTMYVSPVRLLKLDRAYELMFKRPYFARYRYDSWFKELLWKISVRFYKNCDLVITPSSPIKKELEKRKIGVPVEVVSAGLDTSIIPRRTKKKIEWKLLHTGRLSHEKKAEVVIKACSQLLKSYPQASLTIVGGGPSMNTLELLVAELGLQKKVKFLGYVPHAKLMKMYRDYDLFVTASDMETLGLVAVEAMVAGLPVVGVDRYAIPSVVKHRVNGLICKPLDSECIAVSAERILSDPGLYKKYAKKSIERAQEHDMKNTISKLEAIFKKIKKKK